VELVGGAVTRNGTSLEFVIEKLKAPPGQPLPQLVLSGSKSLLGSAIAASTRMVRRAAWPSPACRNPSWLALNVPTAYATLTAATTIASELSRLIRSFLFISPPHPRALKTVKVVSGRPYNANKLLQGRPLGTGLRPVDTVACPKTPR
jgi:hypothetical protein